MVKTIERDESFRFNLSAEERLMLSLVAAHSGISQADELRQLVRNEAIRLGIWQPSVPVMPTNGEPA